jgi:hypothetical protein
LKGDQGRVTKMRGERDPSTPVGKVARTRVSRAVGEVGIWFHSLCLESKKREMITLKEVVRKKHRETLQEEIMAEVKSCILSTNSLYKSSLR